MEITFSDETERTDFLSSNAVALVALARDQNAFMAQERDVLRLFTVTQTCDTVSLDHEFGLRGADARVVKREVLDVIEARRRLARAWSAGFRSGSEVRACVVRFRRFAPDDLADLVLFVPYTGLRGAQIEGADGLIYLAMDESCDLASRFVGAAIARLHGARLPDLYVCANSSLMSCGYPSNITYSSDPGE